MPDRPRDAIAALRVHLDRSLFKPDPGSPRFGRGTAAVLIVAFFVLAIVLQLFRIGPGLALDSLWAEDGPISLQRALDQGLVENLTGTYNGYLIVVAQLIGVFGSLFPLRDAAAAMTIASGFVTALSGLVVWVASGGLIRNPYLRGVLAALTVLSPVAGQESILSGAYVGWYMLFATFWLLLWRPRTTRSAALGGLFALFTGLASPGVWFFAPLALLRGLAFRDRRDGLILGGWALGAVIQIPALIFGGNGGGTTVEPDWSHEIWQAYLQRALDGAAFGERLGGQGWEVFGWALLVALLVAGAVGLYLGLRRSDAAVRWLALVAVPTSLLIFVVSIYQRALGPLVVWPPHEHFGAGGRYAIVPALLLVSVALAIIDGVERRRRSLAPWLTAAAATLLIAGIAISFDVRDPAARGTPAWGDALDQAAVQCRAERLETAVVPISPPPFTIAVPCDRL